MREGSVGRAELVAVLGIILLAAVLRFVDLPTRGTWDADQGTDMLVLWRMVHEGSWPLLGPATSIGDFHHGVLYYYLLAPVAFLSGADPLAVVAFIALCGVAAVAVVWWLARSVGGPLAGLVAAGVMAVSASAIEESTFIWNPNLIALSSAISLVAAWQAWIGRQGRWWIVAAAAQAVTMHSHVLGSVMVLPLAALLVADARRRTSRHDRERVVAMGLVGLALIVLSYVPLLVHELQSGFAETQAAVDFLLGGGARGGVPVASRLLIVPVRVLSWPLTGLITAQPIAGILAAVGVPAILVWRAQARARDERVAARWFAFTLASSAVALALGASSLGAVVPGLPNDHYHAFLDPVVFATVGLGAAALWRRGAVARGVAAVAVTAIIGLNVTIWPPAVAADGGYPQAQAAAARIVETAGGRDYRLDGLPTLKNENAYRFPLTRLGRPPSASGDAAHADLVILCDRLLEPIIEAACDGEAEDARLAELGESRRLVARFDASPRTVVSIYR